MFFRCPVIVRYSTHDQNSQLKVCYSSHDLNSKLKDCYSSYQSRNLSVKQPLTWIANYKFPIQAILNNKLFEEKTILDHLNTELVCYFPPYIRPKRSDGINKNQRIKNMTIVPKIQKIWWPNNYLPNIPFTMLGW